MRLIYEDEDCAAIALFAGRQIEVILADAPFNSFNTNDVTLRVRADGVPGAWYDPDAREIVVDVALYHHALALLTNLFTHPHPSTDLPLVRFAKIYDEMLAHYVTQRYESLGSYSLGPGPNHWVQGCRITFFEAFVADHLETNPDLAVPIAKLENFFASDVHDVVYWLSNHLDQCVDIARFFFLFVCLHELGHYVFNQDTEHRSKLFGIAGAIASRPTADADPDGPARPEEEHYADAFAVIGVTRCRETSISGEQFLFVRAFFEFIVGTLIDTTILLEEILHSASYANNRLVKFLRFSGLRELQRETTTILDKWEVTSRRTRTLDEHWHTFNPSFRDFDFLCLAQLHARWIEQARLIIRAEGRLKRIHAGF